jgi:hypothetical protein
MKVAFTFSGLIKDINKTYPSYQPLIEKYQPDIFFSTWDIENSENGDTIQNFKDKYNPVKIEVDNWEAWKATYWSLIEPNYIVPPLNPYEWNKAKSPGIFSMWYKIQKANHLTKLVNKEYDIVVKLRTDLELSSNFELILNDYLNIPHGSCAISDWEGCWGPHDFMYYGKPKYMDYTTGLFYFISKYHQEGNYMYPPENLLRHHLSQKNIPIRFYPDTLKLRDGYCIPLYNLQRPEEITSTQGWARNSNPKLSYYKK